ncbi:MAG: class I SAM-dependent methyltransferase [Chloroflexi bacterium]|nr:class I SAM-dependent methyltransferase [Chloroflexota bacterium]
MNEGPRICDYGDSSYRQDFWEGQGRDYEDAVERRVLARLLPPAGERLLEIGAGFGRLTTEYRRFRQVVLLDYSLEQLQHARGRFGDDGYVYVAADAYQMPFQPGAFDAATMIRVIHHFEEVPAVLAQVGTALSGGGSFILEFANKHNLKAMLRYLLGLNGWNPYALAPVEFVELNFNFHPEYMAQNLTASGFEMRRTVPVSWLRLGSLKRALPTSLLVRLDEMLQRTAWTLSPSVFLDLRLKQGGKPALPAASNDPLSFLKCPLTGSRLRREGDALVNESGLRWGIRQGVYDFRKPLD